MKDKSIVCNRPHVVVAVFVLKDKKVLMGKRVGSIGAGTWGLPGGKLDFFEELEACAIRETFEEAGIKIKNLRLGTIVNDFFVKEKLHYLSVYFIADYASGTVTIKEPNKCAEWKWVDWENPSKPLYVPMNNLLKQKFDPFKK
jgi:8-oxo-dGTP diphosphatase